MLWKAWRFESKLRKLAGNFNGGLWPAVEVSIGELIANACTDACQESLRRLFHRYTPIQVCVCVRIYTCSSVRFVIVGGLIKARIERNAASIFMRIVVYCVESLDTGYECGSMGHVHNRWWRVLRIVARLLFYAGFGRQGLCAWRMPARPVMGYACCVSSTKNRDSRKDGSS